MLRRIPVIARYRRVRTPSASTSPYICNCFKVVSSNFRLYAHLDVPLPCLSKCTTFLKNRTSFSENSHQRHLFPRISTRNRLHSRTDLLAEDREICFVRNELAISEEMVRCFDGEESSEYVWLSLLNLTDIGSRKDITNKHHFVSHEIEHLVPVSAYVCTSSKVLGAVGVLPINIVSSELAIVTICLLTGCL